MVLVVKRISRAQIQALAREFPGGSHNSDLSVDLRLEYNPGSNDAIVVAREGHRRVQIGAHGQTEVRIEAELPEAAEGPATVDGHAAHIFLGADGQWFWDVKARNGQIVAQGEGYTRREDALRGLEAAGIEYESVAFDPKPTEPGE